MAGDVEPEGGDGVGGRGGVVVESAGESGHLVGLAGPVDDRPVVDDPEAALDGPDEVVGVSEVAVVPRA